MTQSLASLEARPNTLDMTHHLEALGQGDERAFVKVFEFYAPRIKTYLMRCGFDSCTAQDGAQEALTKVWRRAASFDPQRGSASAWVFAIARHAVIDAGRAARDRPDLQADISMPPTPAEDCLRREWRAQVTDVLRTLPPTEALVIKAAFFDDLSHGGIVKELGIPLGTIKSRVRSALRRLRQQLERYHET